MDLSPLVSIVSPVYNGEKFVGRMLKSILAQTYPNIEMICADDGSEDGTEAVVKSFAGAFDEKGMRLVYVKQEHGGQTRAVNTALKLANGEYLSWVDSDDYLTAESVEKKLRVLRDNPQYGVATSDFLVVDESGDIIRRQGSLHGALNFQEQQFYLALAGASIIESNCHMVRASRFDAVFLRREIVPCEEGQNFQLMLPLYYHYKRVYIDEPLACYVVRPNSHYHRKRTPQEITKRNKELISMLEEVLTGLRFPAWEVRKLIAMSCFTQELQLETSEK
jgi:glycosyltransferase involved in cell wall biosynthesis